MIPTTENLRLKYKQVRNEKYTNVPHGLEKMNMSGAAFAIYLAFLRYIQPDDRVELSYSEISDRTGISRRTAIRALGELEEHGLVSRVKQTDENGGLARNAYLIYRPDPRDGVQTFSDKL